MSQDMFQRSLFIHCQFYICHIIRKDRKEKRHRPEGERLEGEKKKS